MARSSGLDVIIARARRLERLGGAGDAVVEHRRLLSLSR